MNGTNMLHTFEILLTPPMTTAAVSSVITAPTTAGLTP